MGPLRPRRLRLPHGAKIPVQQKLLRFLDAGCLELLEDTHKRLEKKGGGILVDSEELKTLCRLIADKSDRADARLDDTPAVPTP